MNRSSDLGDIHGTFCAEKKEKARERIVITFFFLEGRNYVKGYEHVSNLVGCVRGVFVISNVRGFLGDE